MEAYKKSGFSIGFIGIGNMAQAIIHGFLDSGLVPSNLLTVSHSKSAKSRPFIEKHGLKSTAVNSEVVQNSEIVIIAVKPHLVGMVLKEVCSFIKSGQIIVSIAAGISLKDLEDLCPSYAHVIRVMPNTPCMVSAGVSVCCIGSNVTKADQEIVTNLFSATGLCEVLPESVMPAVIGVSGSGPAYCYLAIEALADGGVKMGLPRETALRFAAQTLIGAGKMVLETGMHPGKLKDAVCSPGGTTICAIASLEETGFRSSLIKAVEASGQRSKCLS